MEMKGKGATLHLPQPALVWSCVASPRPSLWFPSSPVDPSQPTAGTSPGISTNETCHIPLSHVPGS